MKILSLLVLLLAAWMPAPVAAETEPPPFEFIVKDTLALTDQDQTAQVVIVNNTTQALTLTLNLGELLPAEAITQSVSSVNHLASPFSLAEPTTLTLSPAGQHTVLISVDASKVEMGDHSVYLMASSDMPVHVARRLITLSKKDRVKQIMPSRLSATVDTWTIKLTQHSPHLSLIPPFLVLADEWTNAALPVQMTGVVSLPTQVLGTLAGNSTGAVEVRAREIITSNAGWLSMPLSMSAAFSPGNYTGSITLATDSSAKLTLLVTHHWIWPLIVVLLVVWILSYSIGRFTNVLNKVWQLREQMEDAYHKLMQPPTATYAGFTLVRLEDAREADLAQLRKLESYSKIDATTDDYKTAQARIVTLDGLASAWTMLPTTLTDLKKVLDELGHAWPEPPEDTMQKLPGFAQEAQAKLVGKQFTLDEWSIRTAELSVAMTAAAAWTTLYTVTTKAWDRIKNGEPALGAEHDQWVKDERMAHSLRVSLWLDPAAQIAAPECAAQVENIRKLANGWKPHIRELTPTPKPLLPLDTQPDVAHGCLPGMLMWLLKLSTRPVASIPARQTGILYSIRVLLGMITQAFTSGPVWRFRRRFSGLMTLIVAAFIAGATALSQVYFGKPFGTLEDYINLIAWTAGVNAVVGGVLTALDRVLLRKEG